MDTFIYKYTTQRENGNEIFTSENLDKLDELADALKDVTINNYEYYELDTATASDKQGDPKHDLKKFTHTSNNKEKVTDTRNGDFEQK